MSAKKKIVVAICSFVVLIVAAVVAVVAVLAARSVTVQSSISVKYKAQEVSGVVSAYYKIGSSGTENKFGEAQFTGGIDEEESELSSVEEEITKQDGYIEFIFYFTNTGSRNYTATFTFEPMGMDVLFGRSYSWENYIDNTTGTTNSLTIKPNGTKLYSAVFKIKFSIETHDNFGGTVGLSGNMLWDLSAATT